jgi:hypothetical protein
MPADPNAPQATPFAEVARDAIRCSEYIAETRAGELQAIEARTDLNEPIRERIIARLTSNIDQQMRLAAALRALAEREAELQRLIGEADGWVQGSGTPAELDEHGQELLTALAALPTALPAAPPAQEGK